MSSAPTPPPAASPRKHDFVRAPRPIAKQLLHWTRALHTYVTMLALILLIFFAFTGFLLNNGSLNDNSGKLFDLTKKISTHRTAEIPVALLAGNNYLSNIEQYLRKHEGARGSLPEKIDEDDPLMFRFQFQAPGRTVEYAILRDSGHIEIDEEYNLLAQIADLHTGDHTGRVWPWFIDATACFLFFAAVSGLILWISLPKRRTLGLIALAASIVICLAVYLYLVP
jgi:uncharacterized protein